MPSMGGFFLASVSWARLGGGVGVVVVGVTLVDVVDVAGLVAVVLVGIALVHVVSVVLSVVLVTIALVDVVDVAGLIPVVFVGVALVDCVLLHSLLLPILGPESQLGPCALLATYIVMRLAYRLSIGINCNSVTCGWANAVSAPCLRFQGPR